VTGSVKLDNEPERKTKCDVYSDELSHHLKLKLIYILFLKYSERTAKKTPHFTITTINWLTLFKEIIAVYSE
jgi:hypothetical protein